MSAYVLCMQPGRIFPFEITPSGGGVAHKYRPDAGIQLALVLTQRQEEIALWTGVEGYSSMYDREGTTGMGLNIGMVYTIETGLSIHERKSYVCIAHLDQRLLKKRNKKVHL